MSITPKGMSIQEAYRLYREGNLLVNRKYQRKLVWTIKEKQRLIDSIMKGYPIPLILFAERANVHGHEKYEILDGVQRLSAIFDFIENKYSFCGKYFDVYEFTRAKKLAEENKIPNRSREKNQFLDSKECAHFLDYQLAVTIYPAMTEEEMIDVFGRINSEGRRLSNQERRQAGVINKFSGLVRDIAFEIRGDVSENLLKLYDMPSISIDDSRENMDYGLKAEDIFWYKQGILWKSQLRDSEDEEMIADILASILLDKPFPKSKEALDDLYDENSDIYSDIQKALIHYSEDEIFKNVIDTFSVIKEVIESYSNEANTFRKVVSSQHRNPAKNPFYTFFMVFYDLMVNHGMSPQDYKGIMESINNLQDQLKNSAHFTKPEDRIRNMDITRGLIQKHFVKKEPSALRHGPGLAIDFENSIRRSKIETSRYEFKQGLFRLSNTPEMDNTLIDRIINTITGIANTGQGDGFVYIGVADEKSDADRIKQVYGKEYLERHGKFIVGIDREVEYKKWSFDQYIEKMLQRIKTSEMSEPLKSQILSQIDIIDYKGYSIIRIRVPRQNEITFVGDKVFTRQGNKTVELKTKKEVLALSKNFL